MPARYNPTFSSRRRNESFVARCLARPRIGHVGSPDGQGRARHRCRPRHRPRLRAQARVGGLRHRRQLLQQPRGSRRPLQRAARPRAGARSRCRRASAIPDSVDEMFEALAQAVRPARHRREQRGVRRAEAGDGDEAQALALVPGDQRLRAEPARAARAAADERRRAHRRDVEPGRAARDAELRLRRRVEGGAGSRWCARSRRSSARAASA